MRFAASVVAAAILAACYMPSPPAGAPCDPVVPQCPFGQSCTAGGPGGGFICSSGGDDRPDGTVGGDASSLCFGTGLVRNLCLASPPSGALSIVGGVSLDTATVGAANCTTIVAQVGGPSLCVVARRTIKIESGATLRATGPNPLVLVASETIDVVGTLDASGHKDGAAGPGALPTCGIAGAGQDALTMNGNGGGGGAGGSFGTAGGAGGKGRGNIPGGLAGVPIPPLVLIGGCPGARGGNGEGGGGSGSGGPGGGAVYAIARSISVSGTIAAAGGGGGGGRSGADSGGGGGGGGAGGLIGLDAPVVSVTAAGRLIANGGGGGGGHGNDIPLDGQPGQDPSVPTTPAAGGPGGQNGGGNGGTGFAKGSPAKSGNDTGSMYCGGGGGGGGAGAIRVHQAPAGSLGGAVSPPPT